MSSWERHKVINADANALERANEYKETIAHLINEIEHLYYIENKEPDEIADYLFKKHGRLTYSGAEKKKLTDYITRVIKSKLKNNG